MCVLPLSILRKQLTCEQKKGVDLLLVDSGDLHDGTGITDGYPAGGVDAHDVRLLLLPNDAKLNAHIGN